ncbi:ARM repeat-containing protein [Schizophyllum commune H4-8]|uniref:Uncharacterized protein n=1 Tax=Schizophyllum commune (strain H4-8 / FGSC 9210) TaxID=578458 RepID=D8PP29_SCHCM|nr:ARM repeat-containing protein [Schizophyllum commune H4-8]KAI5893359.1 ARM repeat-containing protein [Schizophyllum commune H4-8]
MRRLHRCYEKLTDECTVTDASSLEEVQRTTASSALRVIEQVQRILDSSPSDEAVIGTRDIGHLRTLISIVFKWGTEPLLAAVMPLWPLKSSKSRSRFQDISSAGNTYSQLATMASKLLSLVFPCGMEGKVAETAITTTLIHRHLVDLLKPCVTLGWLPGSIATPATPVQDNIRPLVMRLLHILPSAQIIVALGGLLSWSPLPLHVHRACTTLLSRQLLRPDGVRGLCAAIFGEEKSAEDETSLDKLQHVAKILIAIPAGIKPEEYFTKVIPRILELLTANVPASYRRASAFAISRMLSSDGSYPHAALASSILLPMLHRPLLEYTSDDTTTELAPSRALDTLVALVSNTDPSPELMTMLLSPVASALYSLKYHLDRTKTSDPTLKESVGGLLSTWGRIVSAEHGIDTFWRIVDGEGGFWETDLEGNIKRVEKPNKLPSLSMLTPVDREKLDELDINANILDLYPDPAHFVQFLQSIDRNDIAAELFVRLLEAYRQSKTRSEQDPTRSLLLLQLVLQMQTKLSGDATSGFLKRPSHILAFIKHTLESLDADKDKPSERLDVPDEQLETLRIVPSMNEEDDDAADSDDEHEGANTVSPDDEMLETTVNLLLSILEANEDLSARTDPILNDIFVLLEPLSMTGSDAIRPLAREARVVMTARLASTSGASTSSKSSKKGDAEDAQETYQKALKLLQDPIMPVRAHGLLLLRQLVSPGGGKRTTGVDARAPTIDRALLPAILSIFLQCVQDDDSYLYLNALQGLAAMVDSFGKEVLRGLLNDYSGKLDGLQTSTMTQQDLDVRIRVGEALGLVIKRCGEALGIYVDMLVPVLFSMVRSAYLPTTLRTSALSLLGDCVHTYALAMLPYVPDLTSALLDLLQVEGVVGDTVPEKAGKELPAKTEQQLAEGRKKPEHARRPKPAPSMDSLPTSTNSKFPPLRRAALHFLALLIRTTTQHRAKITLGYIASTDQDGIVRVMAREAVEELGELERAL